MSTPVLGSCGPNKDEDTGGYSSGGLKVVVVVGSSIVEEFLSVVAEDENKVTPSCRNGSVEGERELAEVSEY